MDKSDLYYEKLDWNEMHSWCITDDEYDDYEEDEYDEEYEEVSA